MKIYFSSPNYLIWLAHSRYKKCWKQANSYPQQTSDSEYFISTKEQSHSLCPATPALL